MQNCSRPLQTKSIHKNYLLYSSFKEICKAYTYKIVDKKTDTQSLDEAFVVCNIAVPKVHCITKLHYFFRGKQYHCQLYILTGVTGQNTKTESISEFMITIPDSHGNKHGMCQELGIDSKCHISVGWNE